MLIILQRAYKHSYVVLLFNVNLVFFFYRAKSPLEIRLANKTALLLELLQSSSTYV